MQHTHASFYLNTMDVSLLLDQKETGGCRGDIDSDGQSERGDGRHASRAGTAFNVDKQLQGHSGETRPPQRRSASHIHFNRTARFLQANVQVKVSVMPVGVVYQMNRYGLYAIFTNTFMITIKQIKSITQFRTNKEVFRDKYEIPILISQTNRTAKYVYIKYL